MRIEELKYYIRTYEPFDEQEINDKETILEFMDRHHDVLTRDNTFGHLTASAFVVDSSKNRMLMVNHNIFNGLIYPGGHADGDANLFDVATREVFEETGIHVSPLFNGDIFSIQALPIKGHVKHGKYVSAHIHYDILYALIAEKENEDKIRVLETENSLVKWVDFENLESENQVDWIKPINEKLVKKFRLRGKR